MAKYPKMTITNAGLDMIAESAADAKALIFTRVKLGDGSLTTQSIMDLTELVNEKMTVELSSGEAQAGGQTKLRFAVSNSGLDEGFFAREIGLYAKVGEDGAEGLYAYTNGASYVDYIPDKSNPLDAQVVDIYVITANASSIKIEVSSAAYATVQDLVEHNAGANSHPNGLTAPLMIWESGEIYKVNDVRVHEKKIWMCIEGNSDVVFDKAKWENIGGGGGKTVGEIVWRAFNDSAGPGELVANGTTVDRAMYPDYAKYCADNNYPWGAGDGVTTVNLPNLIGKFAEGATTAGGYHEAGLPNIEGSAVFGGLEAIINVSGAFSTVSGAASSYNAHYSGGDSWKLNLDASKSNPIYGNSNTVQPHSALLIPYVVVFTEQTAESAMIDVTQYAQELANKVNRSEADYVVDSYHDDDGNWYRVYKSGWVEQGGILPKPTTAVINVSLLKPFADNNYNVSVTPIKLSSTAYYTMYINSRETTLFKYTSNSGAGWDNVLWYACGQGATE